MNKQRAEIQLGSRLGFQTLSQNFTSTIQQVQFLNTGTLLRLRPFVSDDGMVRMEIHPERSSGSVTNNIPNQQTAELTTNVMVPDGATLVIGGLIEDEDDFRYQGLPLLSRFPALGFLTGARQKTEGRRELVVLLTPHIWSPSRRWPMPRPRTQARGVRASGPVAKHLHDVRSSRPGWWPRRHGADARQTDRRDQRIGRRRRRRRPAMADAGQDRRCSHSARDAAASRRRGVLSAGADPDPEESAAPHAPASGVIARMDVAGRGRDKQAGDPRSAAAPTPRTAVARDAAVGDATRHGPVTPHGDRRPSRRWPGPDGPPPRPSR